MKKKARGLKMFIKCLLALLGVFMMIFLVDWYVSHEGEKYIVNTENAPKADAVIVLGAYVFPDGNVSDMLADRLSAGCEIYNLKKAGKILVSGDHGTVSYDEVNGMRKYLQNKGVPREDIFMDHAGFNTYDTLYRARDVFEVKKAVIVTQRYHLVRALYIARQLGIEAYGVTSDRYVYPGMAYYRARELGSRFKAFLQAGILHSKPKYLGDVIPISGSGLLTDDRK